MSIYEKWYSPSGAGWLSCSHTGVSPNASSSPWHWQSKGTTEVKSESAERDPGKANTDPCPMSLESRVDLEENLEIKVAIHLQD